MSNDLQAQSTPAIRSFLIDLAVMTVIGIVLALIGPFGSFQEPIAMRLIVWLGFAYVGYALYAPIDGVAQKMAPRLDLPVWAVRLAACFVASVPMAVVVWVLPRLPDRVRIPDANTALEQYLYVFLVGGLVTVIFTLLHRAKPPEGIVPHRVEAAQVRFLERLPPSLGSELVALEMEDHYVRAHTPLGSDLVLLRMRDAVAELEGLDGAQVHRSWWVARGAVEDVKREGRNIRLVLANGIEAPVARANVKPLRDAGWL
ncbi:LytTR family DNA-binding domain-containing protein [Qipengyuania sphaerica]|uniref:LytTR family DNA-binding domain-containing protein n=1 Tax=Qipengyuania sphaerica TaxID=2867243 RepID=UPI001C86EE11|nr:LytTR family DNA-binding domain-containing protein [Qipengyuania sphaerica]MBX7539553.1 LytTR family transcriptional regulator DNA-binding domain-containing protein [Qipengyuania sphaerica]